jgi:outer membrane protein assembly factor BamB
MRRCSVLLLLVCAGLSCADPATETFSPVQAAEPVGPFAETDWPWWRGQHNQGVAPASSDPPLEWSETENVVWKTKIPGRGQSSPVIVGDHIYLTSSDEEAETRFVLAFDRASGAQLWQTVVHTGSPILPKNEKATQASSTLACDGQRIFANFLHEGALYTSALSLKGKLLWQTRVCDYIMHQGYGSSPTVYEGLVLVAADSNAGGAVAGLDRQTGKIVWKHDRPELPNYPSPTVLEVAGKPQLLMTGCHLVTSLNPLTGKVLWEIPGSTTECVTSPVTNGTLIYSSGGYPDNHVAGIKADGSGEVVWQIGTRVYVPSMLIKNNRLHGVNDTGIAYCWDGSTGDELWKGRLQGAITSSPVLVGDLIFVTNESGETFVYKAQADELEIVARNQLGDECFATPTFSGKHIYTRVGHRQDGNRQEYLYCLGKK